MKSRSYNVRAEYQVEAHTRVGNVDFLRDEVVGSPSQALELTLRWQHPDISLKLKRTIYFERRDGFLSDEKPIEEDLTPEKLRLLIVDESLPRRSYDVPLDVVEARAMVNLATSSSGRQVDFGG